jgi:hypothetical protein
MAKPRDDLDRAADRAESLLYEYRYVVGGALLLLLAQSSGQGVTIGDTVEQWVASIPPEVWVFGRYAAIGMVGGAPLGYYVYKHFYTVDGVEILELDPVGNRHRHLRLGNQLWDDLVVRSPWGTTVGTEELQQVSVNGRTGYELMDLQNPDDGPPTCVATWMGEASAAELRTYKYAVVEARKRLSRKANQAIAQEAARESIVREAAERVVVGMIRTSERSGVPHGDEVEDAVDDVLGDMGLDSPLSDSDLHPDDLDLDSLDDERGASDEQRNGSADDSPDLEDVVGVGES